MKFTKEYSKLKKKSFTTIRKNLGYYQRGQIIEVHTPKQGFIAEIQEIRHITKDDITEELALKDADCTRKDLIALLERWYGPDYDDFILIFMYKW